MLGKYILIRKFIFGMLFTTLGTMWLSIAIAPCVLAATLDDRLHQCCPHFKDATHNEHLHDQEKCISCEVVGPVLQSADNYIKYKTLSKFDFEPIIIEWNTNQVARPIPVTVKLSAPVYLPIPPPLLYRVLLI